MPQRSKRPASCESCTITYQGLHVIIAAIETYDPTNQLRFDQIAAYSPEARGRRGRMFGTLISLKGGDLAEYSPRRD
jgi:hypothetical protein